jgi:alpha-1,2-mannosyltransferase
MINKRGFLSYIVIVCLINVIFINGSIAFFYNDNTLTKYAEEFLLIHPKYTDSWEPMNRALNVFRSGEDPTIYQKVFFDQKHKFQYPPTSLLIIDFLKRVFPNSESAQSILGWISWLCVWGTIAFSTVIFLEETKKRMPDEYFRYKWIFTFLTIIIGLSFYPILRGFYVGQIQIWLNFLFTLSLWFWMRKDETKSGVCIGLIAIIKPQMGLFSLWGLIRKNWKFCASLLGVVTFVLLISLWRYGLSSHLKYIEVLRFIGTRGESYYANQSINGLLNRILFNGSNLEWNAFKYAPENGLITLITTISSAILLFILFIVTWKSDNKDDGLDFSLAALVFTMASPVAWEHHYGILLPIFGLLFPRVWEARRVWKGGVFWLLAAYLLTANFYSITQSLADTNWNFLQSYVFFGGLIILGVIVKLKYITKSEKI